METDSPQSLYAATKKSGELLVSTYGKLYNFNVTTLRFFTVYGPYGRPDMAIYKFTESIIGGKTIELYNHGKHIRDFTFIDDVVDAINKVLDSKSNKKNTYEIFNVASSKPESLIYFLNTIEKELGIKSKIKKISLQDGDVYKTYASISKLKKKLNYEPKVQVKLGVKKFVNWYLEYNNIK
jgi:UDP-glucuronate 4-epimerase